MDGDADRGSHEYRARTGEVNDWAALSVTAFNRNAVENADGYNIMAWRSNYISWEFVGASQRA